jgi:acyl-CoA synthetase (AMP-forming)/AMP-acid ligase II
MPINPQLREAEIGALFDDRRPALVVLGPDGHADADAAAGARGIPVRQVEPGRRLGIGATVGSDPPAAPEPDAVALILHTSGTTSRPKMVPLRQRNVAASARSIAGGYGLGVDDTSYCVMPLFHIHGLVASVLAALASGGCVVIPRRVWPSGVWDHASLHGITWFSAVPTILGKVPTPPGEGITGLRFVRSCSSALSPRLWRELEDRFGVPVVEAYGMTEASHQMTSNPLPPGERRPGTVGIPAGAEVTILDEAWRPMPHGVAGEVSVRGPAIVDGYLDNPEANAKSFRDGWFRTGDLGTLSEDGYLVLEGRIKELINRGGEKIAPREIDEVLLEHPGVLEAVAYGVPSEKWGEVVHAAVVARSEVTAEQLREHCAARIASFKVPRTIHLVPEIPKGPTGKIQRRTLTAKLG